MLLEAVLDEVGVYAMPAGTASTVVRIFLSPASTAMAPSGSTSMMTTSPSCGWDKGEET